MRSMERTKTVTRKTRQISRALLFINVLSARTASQRDDTGVIRSTASMRQINAKCNVMIEFHTVEVVLYVRVLTHVGVADITDTWQGGKHHTAQKLFHLL
jgi:hypothetical protein